MLAVRDLHVRYGPTTIVHGLNLEVAAGELLALIGPNGAGKTTSFKAIGGQVRAATGDVRLNGQRMLGLSPRRVWQLGVGRTFQITATFASMSVRENVQMGLVARSRRLLSLGRSLPQRQISEADALLAAVGMADQAKRLAGVLAYGDLKRLELAIALTNRPKLLLMDEPTAGMAAGERHALMDLTRRLARERSIAVLFTDHDVDTVFAVADRVQVLARGRTIAAGPPAMVRADPQVAAVYLGSAGVTASALEVAS